MFELYYTTAIVILMIAALARDLFEPSLIVFGTLLLLMAGRVVTVEEAFDGFSNKGMLTVAFLFVVSGALQSSHTFERFVIRMLGENRSGIRSKYLRLMFPVAGLSAFLNNTPIVASLIPIVKSWSKRYNMAASKFLIPLSYAAVLGGTCTLIGTSTNLVVHGMLEEAGLSGFDFFEISKIGIPVAVLGILFLAIIGNYFLPDRKGIVAQLGERTREFVVEMRVGREFPHLNQTVEAANLRHLQGLFLFQINRDGEVIAPVSPGERILEDDRLFFTGVTETIYQLQKTPGLQVVKDPEFDPRNLDSDKYSTFEAVISNTSPLVGQTVRESGFRTHYDAVILAIHRSGERIRKKIGDIVIQANDTLFLLARKNFEDRWYHSRDFSLVSPSLEIYSKPRWKGNLALGLLVMMVIAAATGFIPIIFAAALAALAMVMTGIINLEDAKNSINWGVLLIIACSFGIARGLDNSGLAEVVAGGLVNTLDVFGSVGIIAGLFAATSLFTLLITNNAAAAIMFPVALSIAQSIQLDIRPVMLTLVMAASTCFASPVGYQTNLMVYSAGNYRFSDFFKLGFLMNVFVGVCVIAIIYLLFI